MTMGTLPEHYVGVKQKYLEYGDAVLLSEAGLHTNQVSRSSRIKLLNSRKDKYQN